MTQSTDAVRQMIAETRKRTEAAQKLIVALCKPDGAEGARRWIMSIPARVDYDPDLVIGDALRGSNELARVLEILLADLEQARSDACKVMDWAYGEVGSREFLSQDVENRVEAYKDGI